MGAKTAITPTRLDDYAEWYQQVVKQGDLAENSSVRGCMIIKPWGYGLWENMQQTVDNMLKKTGHKNAYFPIFIPLSLMSKEAEHVEGFATECAVVTHHRLEKGEGNKLHPAGPLEEPLIVRPTSEMIINEAFARWVKSYRDLPLLINQWANVVRWEMRTRLFLRTAEFLWQEGHTVHATAEEAVAETEQMLNIYEDFLENWLAMPVVKGRKSESERFPGADDTYTVETLMQDGKALQAGTSHFLGQNFAKAAGIRFQDKDGEEKYAWTTSWAVTTRLIGGMIMMHGDDDGLVLPPKIAPAHIVLLPILKGKEDDDKILEFCQTIKENLSKINYHGRSILVELDDRDINGKKWDWVRKGIPLRVEIGAKEVAEGKVSLQKRTSSPKEREELSLSDLEAQVVDILDGIQNSLYEKALTHQKEHTQVINNKDDFYAFFSKSSEGITQGGFVKAYWNGCPEVEKKIKDDLAVTIRCLPLDEQEGIADKVCALTGEPAKNLALFAKAY
ncbi:MAG: proline--tRNA ligase [Alphaproteobacteria bacterium]|nr:proline--tRNA ligase [Alphaproteobacteria bacterium]MDD9920251.1 proline--tRNA ligase [Alphaproteobacteria bacterium]